MKQSRISAIKHAQKESLYLREIAQHFTEVVQDNPELMDIFITRVALSPDKGHVTVYFYTAQGKEHFDQLLGKLILYKPSMRHMLSQRITGRYTPDLTFAYDAVHEKQQRIESLLESIKQEDES